jgi:hypothetical protein
VTSHHSITEITRRAIIDQIIGSGLSWSGRLPENDFLARIYNLRELPSTDYRYDSAAADIQQHRISWHDWPDDWVFYDDRFNILHGSDDNFMRFLAEMLHPVVRPNDWHTNSTRTSKRTGGRLWNLPKSRVAQCSQPR